MSNIKKGKFSDYQFSKEIFSKTNERRSDIHSSQTRSNVYELHQINDFYQRTAKVNAKCSQRIQTTQNRINKAFQNYQKRINLGSNFLNYKENPFYANKRINHNQQKKVHPNTTNNRLNDQMTERRFFKRQKTIIDSVSNLSSKSQGKIYDLRLHSKTLDKPKKFDFMKRAPQVKQNTPIKKKQLSIVIPKEEKVISVNALTLNQNFMQTNESLADLDHIARLRDTNFFKQRLKDKEANNFNILPLQKGSGSDKKNINLLVQNKFCFESEQEHLKSKNRIQVEQHINPVYKRVVVDDYGKVISQGQLNRNAQKAIDIDSICFRDMLNLANGKVDPVKRKEKLVNVQPMSLGQAFETIRIDNLFDNVLDSSVMKGLEEELQYIKNPMNYNNGSLKKRSKTYERRINQITAWEKECEERQIMDLHLMRKLREEKYNIMREQIQEEFVQNDKEANKGDMINKLIHEKIRAENTIVRGLHGTANNDKIKENFLKNRSKIKKNDPFFEEL